MKTLRAFFILLVTLIIASTSYGQIQLNANDIYTPGEYKMARTSTSFIIPGKAGENQIWDFSKLKELGTELITIEAYKNDGTAKDADLIEKVDGIIKDYYKKTSSGIYTVTGNEEGGYQNIKFMSFPATYGQWQIDSAQNISHFLAIGQDSIDSVRVTTKIKIQSETDAWGILKIPNGEFNTLRLKMNISYQIKQEGKKGLKPYKEIPNSFIKDTFVNYQWYTNDKGYYILSYHQKRYVKYLFIEPVHVDKSKKSNTSICVSNPISTTLKISNSGPDNFNIILFDLAGKRVLDDMVGPLIDKTFDVSFLNAGIYYVQLTNIEKNTLSFQKIIK